MKKGLDYIGVAVGVMIFNEKGELFISKRSQNCTNERGKWEIPGGSVEFGEKLTEAAIREAKEEFGIDIAIIKQFPAADHILDDENQHWVPTTFLARITGDSQPVIMEPHKCDAIGWFPLDSLPQPLSVITAHDIMYYTRYARNA